jgi:PAS domain S-box-containing protein
MMPSPSADQLAYFGPLLDHTEDAIVATDADWRVTVWNEGARRMYGWTAEETVGQPVALLELDESDEQRMDDRRQLAEHGRWRGEITVERRDGTKVPVEAIAVAICDEQGRVSGYLAIHRDITERTRAEEALRAANRRTEAILERISDTFFALDGQWRYTYVNGRAVAMAREAWGREVSAEELLGKNCWELFPETVGTAFDQEFHRAVREQKVAEFETCSLATDAWVEVRAYPSSDGLSVYLRDVTARRRGQEALAYHASLLDNLEDGVVATDGDDFRITAWNKGAEQLYGFTAEEVLGRPAREVASYPGDEARRNLEHELLETGRSRIEFTAYRKDGTPIEVELIAAKVRNDRGELDGYLGIHRDITERKRAERAVREAQRRSETILESITDDFVALDQEWRYTYINDRALRSTQEWLGWPITREELLGRSLWEVFPENVGTVPYVKYHQAVRERRPVEFETYFAAKDSWFETHVYPSESGLSIYFRTITERKRSEAALRAATRRSETILESIGDDFIAVDRAWRITYMNQRALANSRKARGEELSRDDLLGRSYWEVFPETVGTALDREFHRAVHEQEVVRFEAIGPLNGVRFDICAYPTDDGLSVYSRDITERKQAEQRVVEAREAERGRIARALHDEALQSVSDATALAAMADRTAAESPLAGQLLSALRKAGEQLRSAIYDLRLGAEEHRPFVELLEQLVHEHRTLASDREIQLEIGRSIPSGSLGVVGIELLRILGEALTNVRRHADARHVRVRVWATNDGLSVEVADDGRGFDTMAAVSPIHQGLTGMRERAELLGGHLEIRSEPGAGTTVRLEAPLVNGTNGDT